MILFLNIPILFIGFFLFQPNEWNCYCAPDHSIFENLRCSGTEERVLKFFILIIKFRMNEENHIIFSIFRNSITF